MKRIETPLEEVSRLNPASPWSRCPRDGKCADEFLQHAHGRKGWKWRFVFDAACSMEGVFTVADVADKAGSPYYYHLSARLLRELWIEGHLWKCDDAHKCYYVWVEP